MMDVMLFFKESNALAQSQYLIILLLYDAQLVCA